MKIFQVSIILINLSAATYLIFRIVSFHQGRRISKLFGIPRSRSENLIRKIYLIIALGIIIYTFFFFGLEITSIVSSIYTLIVIALSKILIANSTYYISYPSEKIDKLDSALTVALFFSLLLILVSLGIMLDS